MVEKQEEKATRDFSISIPPGLVEKLGLNPDEEYQVECLLLSNKTLNLRFLRKGKQDGATKGEDE